MPAPKTEVSLHYKAAQQQSTMLIDTSLLSKYNKPGPRYTSYPPANFFSAGTSAKDYENQLKKSNNEDPRNISLYVHVPFCPKLCHFCGCNTQIFNKEEQVKNYFKAVETEIFNIAQHLDKSRKVTQVHWGGGTPNAVSMHYIHAIMEQFRSLFEFSPNAEIAMECNPAYMDANQVKELATSGINRVSLGIQDFDSEVLRTINRDPSLLPIEETCHLLRRHGIQSINFDFVYGLPGQTKERFSRSIEQAIKLAPDRIVTFSYAHVPWVKKAQKILEKQHIPEAEEKIEMLLASESLLTAHGYTAIGIDHYAKPDDELCSALATKQLHRNFQGYCTRATTGQVYAFGCSSISQLAGGYFQNVKSTEEYISKIQTEGYATERGYLLSKEELVIREVINEIMCNHYADFDAISEKFAIGKQHLFSILQYSPNHLKDFAEDGMVSATEQSIEVLPQGYYFVRNIAMVFDPQLSVGENTYSKTV